MIIMLLAASTAYTASILGTKHDLSGAGYGTTQICIFCHTPHNAVTSTIPAPLWNHGVTTATYTLYSSATLNATIGQPGPTSKACMSCHDGTVAVDSYYGHGTAGAYEYGGGPTLIAGTHIMTGTAMLGTDLSNDHPVGFNYTLVQTPTDPGIRASAAGKVNGIYPLYGAGNVMMECPTCHAVHDNAFSPFLRASNAASALCLGCHLK